MRVRAHFVLVICAIALGCPRPSQTPPDDAPPLVEDPAAHVDPFIGSGGFGFAAGSAFPGALVPHGLVKVGPDTRGDYGTVSFLHFSGYW